jgi:uncharacterized membrane protein YcaP (DUF421 family)
MLFVGRLMSYLRYLCLFAHSGVLILCFCFAFCRLKLLSKQNMHLFDSILMAVFASAVYHGLEHQSVQIKNYKISMCCFSVYRARSIKK